VSQHSEVAADLQPAADRRQVRTGPGEVLPPAIAYHPLPDEEPEEAMPFTSMDLAARIERAESTMYCCKTSPINQ